MAGLSECLIAVLTMDVGEKGKVDFFWLGVRNFAWRTFEVMNVKVCKADSGELIVGLRKLEM